jgi:hypothetical protein
MQTTKVITTKTTKETEACFLKQSGTNTRGKDTTTIQTNAFNVKDTSLFNHAIYEDNEVC